MARQYKKFEPDWYCGEIPADSYRSIFRWGGGGKAKTPGESFYRAIRRRLGLSDEDFRTYREDLGLDAV
ncbi:MAG: hypothetical protein LBH57_07170, partial [Treponema sp.]|nr:hypothetical protein [Treponema sp.]